jgi:hypothetical protein
MPAGGEQDLKTMRDQFTQALVPASGASRRAVLLAS